MFDPYSDDCEIQLSQLWAPMNCVDLSAVHGQCWGPGSGRIRIILPDPSASRHADPDTADPDSADPDWYQF